MAEYTCEYDRETFDEKSRHERHMASAHPPRAASAADVENAERTYRTASDVAQASGELKSEQRGGRWSGAVTLAQR